MNEKILKSLQSAINDNKEATRRRFPRRMTDICVAQVDGTNYPVRDWSQCGVLFEADGRVFESNTECSVVMKFKLSDVVTEIPVKARVIRASKVNVALEFIDVPKKIQSAFSKVIESTMALKPESEQQA
ncbi:MAG: hypothetical protein EBQ96_02720 [Proteobacteria bacterium]|nr:hypothetical protein [Pseudomonadota bacterium]